MKKTELKGYDRYKFIYNKEKEALRKQGRKMVDRMYSETEYNVMSQALKNDYKSAGKRLRDPAYALVQEQKYDISFKEARGIRRALIEAGDREVSEIPSMKLLREQGTSAGDLFTDAEWAFISEKYYELKEGGMSGKEAGNRIGSYYFGSI